MHQCTDAELAKFYKPARGSKNEFDNLVENKNLMCMNELDDKGEKVNKRIYGATGNSFKSIENLAGKNWHKIEIHVIGQGFD